MSDFLRILQSYAIHKIKAITVIIVSIGIFLLVFSLYHIPLEPACYAVLLAIIFIFIIGIIDFINFYRMHKTLNKLKQGIAVSDYMFPKSRDMIDADYQELISIIDKSRMGIIEKKDEAFNDMLDYYTIWAHQIKTPIAAMRLILQSEPSERNSELLEQLFKVEQYVEMVLGYLRMKNMSNDLVLKHYSLDDIVRAAVRKYSRSFIRKKIKLNYNDLNCSVLTDEKWLSFVVEQILSNSLKYTNSGEISIYMEDDRPYTMVIEDTGIGIEQEDLPRVFEKGFTGYNGRCYKKSTGIGLYLCKQVLNKLSHTIAIESVVGKGTKVKIGFHSNNIGVE